MLLPTGTEYHVDMSRIFPQCLSADLPDRLARAHVLLREEPDEEEEDEGKVRDDEEEEDEEENVGYSVQVYRFSGEG